MRKSSVVKLVLLGGAGVALAACSDDAPPNDAQFFADAQECSAVYGEQACAETIAAAQKVSEDEAPRYTRQEECEAEFGVGNCETRQYSGGGGFFTPYLMGSMIGNMSGSSRYYQPVYRGPHDEAMMARNGSLYNVGSFTRGAGKSAGFQKAVSVSRIERGGFGGTSRSFRVGG